MERELRKALEKEDWQKSGMADRLSGRRRSIYLTGANKGELRPSRRTRHRRRRRRDEERLYEERLSAGIGKVGLADARVKDGPEAEMFVEGKTMLLGRGFREKPDGETRYEVESSEGEECGSRGRWIFLDGEEIRSGRRLFRVDYPDDWMDRLTKKGREEKASRGSEDYGKEYVEYEGLWWEVEASQEGFGGKPTFTQDQKGVLVKQGMIFVNDVGKRM